MLFAAGADMSGSVLNPMGLIRLARSPQEIGESAVRWRWIWVVASLMPWWARANKCFQYQPMNLELHDGAISAQANVKVAVTTNSRPKQSLLEMAYPVAALPRCPANAPKRRHLVKAIVPNYTFPLLHNANVSRQRNAVAEPPKE